MGWTATLDPTLLDVHASNSMMLWGYVKFSVLHIVSQNPTTQQNCCVPYLACGIDDIVYCMNVWLPKLR